MSSRREVLTELQPGPTTHAGLWLDKGLADVAAEGGHRQVHFEGLMESIKIPGGYKSFFARWREHVAQVPPFTILAEAQVRGRLIVGLGAESILETGMTLNRTYGVPYLPGSSLKGLASSSAHKTLEDGAWRKETGESHRTLFGDQESSGYVTFHDALWIPDTTEKLPFDLDVMTVHYPKYYQGEATAPSGIESPNPVAFLTTHGRFLLAVSGPEVWAKTALGILQEALREDGLGAKTAAGYGRMDVSGGGPRNTASPQKPVWENRVKGIGFQNADPEVPRLLKELIGDDRKAAALAIIKHLGDKELRDKKRRDKEWVKLLREAASGETE